MSIVRPHFKISIMPFLDRCVSDKTSRGKETNIRSPKRERRIVRLACKYGRCRHATHYTINRAACAVKTNGGRHGTQRATDDVLGSFRDSPVPRVGAAVAGRPPYQFPRFWPPRITRSVSAQRRVLDAAFRRASRVTKSRTHQYQRSKSFPFSSKTSSLYRTTAGDASGFEIIKLVAIDKTGFDPFYHKHCAGVRHSSCVPGLRTTMPMPTIRKRRSQCRPRETRADAQTAAARSEAQSR